MNEAQLVEESRMQTQRDAKEVVRGQIKKSLSDKKPDGKLRNLNFILKLLENHGRSLSKVGRRKHKLSSSKKDRTAVWTLKKKVTGKKDQSKPQARYHGGLDPRCSLGQAKRGDLRTATDRFKRSW